jgi:hypothetical protein
VCRGRGVTEERDGSKPTPTVDEILDEWRSISRGRFQKLPPRLDARLRHEREHTRETWTVGSAISDELDRARAVLLRPQANPDQGQFVHMIMDLVEASVGARAQERELTYQLRRAISQAREMSRAIRKAKRWSAMRESVAPEVSDAPTLERGDGTEERTWLVDWARIAPGWEVQGAAGYFRVDLVFLRPGSRPDLAFAKASREELEDVADDVYLRCPVVGAMRRSRPRPRINRSHLLDLMSSIFASDYLRHALNESDLEWILRRVLARAEEAQRS